MTRPTRPLAISKTLLTTLTCSILGTAATAGLLATDKSVIAAVVALLTIQALLLILIHAQSANYRRQEKRARTWGVRHSVSHQELAHALKVHRNAIIQTNDAALAETVQHVTALHSSVQALQELIAQSLREERRAVQEEQLRRRQALFQEIFQDAM